MTPAFCKAFVLALDIVEHRFPKGVVVTTSAITKFFSNGLDYESAIKTKGFFEESLYPLWRRLLTFVLDNTLSLIDCLGDGRQRLMAKLTAILCLLSLSSMVTPSQRA